MYRSLANIFRKAVVILTLVWSSALLSSESLFLPPGGSAEYANKVTWLSECRGLEKYRIGEDIVACINEQEGTGLYRLILSSADDFAEVELDKMQSGKSNHELPSRDHPYF